ncbi:CoA transferase [Roseinatronobacter bogoriensis]|uniref:2-methylfumaryl-CoA isomerase n=1 Tax=Roseinatronobacter bogoriensis subsp. barguzinensis TaxID=441209 RepID=A0A2K8KF20_9RHOB|nr:MULTISPECIES: CoA transferase [Rhodobaca]ATX65368.1 2-methylfumaryl-CoA isomerase [Rhodobaca barguzinensis]MBB4208947.1 2-methylfumaryl-CoA isomerase [Rhodobaca bogoriensis DSM 18756]TDW37627.1 2-methylfumaryl-CoA isomerase [Rhodobaca barguzinensis]TDY68237.1 2-methylfumaryl-CoA isomerase [Rhodobaca bogoriensis DSM 18756]
MGILKGMRVVEGSAFVAIPLAGMTLAQMGAEVIRFDRIEGGLDAARWPVTEDGQSLFWAGLNKGKKSVAVDMKSPKGRELITRIITAPGEDAGLFLTNLRVRGWMDHETLSRHRDDLVMVALLGDRHGRAAVDYSVNPSLGFPTATGPEGSTEPVAHVLPAWDCIAGNMAVTALLAAERHRLRTGQGQEVLFSLKDAAAAMLGNLGIIGEVAVNGTDRPKYGNALYGGYGQDFICADGARVMVIGLTDRQWRGLVKATGMVEAMAALEARLGESLAREGARFRHRAAITEVLAPFFAARKVEDFAKAFDTGGVTWSQFRSFAEAVREDPDLSTENPMFHMLEQPGIGSYPTPASPLSFSEIARQAPNPAPALGAHTEEVLADVAGLQSGEIGALFDEGVVTGPRRHPAWVKAAE